MSGEPPESGREGSAESRAAALWRRATAPARSEQAAFRVVLWAAGIAIALAVIAALIRAIT